MAPEPIFSDEKIMDGDSIGLREFVDKASKIILKRDLNIDKKESQYLVSAGTHFRLKFPDGNEFPKNGEFSAVPNIARNLQQHFGLEKVKDFSEDDNLVGRREKYTLDTGYPAGVMGWVSLSSAAQDFVRFIEFLEEEGYLSSDDVDKAKVYAKATGHHPLVKSQGEASNMNGEKFSGLNREGVDQDTLSALGKNTNVIVEGVAGSGKSHLLGSLRRAFYKQEESKITYWVAPEENKKDTDDERNRKAQQLEVKKSEGFSLLYGENGNQIEVVVFHPSTSYEEFVSGIRPNFSKQEGESDFVTQEGIFVQMCNRAAQDPDNTYLLFIDEINRANTSRVFGDLMLVLEKSKRQEFKDLPQEGRSGALFEATYQNMPGDYVRLQTPIFKNGKEYNKLAVPENLHVLGTMNTTDRSVGTIDLALRRRFHWVTHHPFTAEELQAAMEENGEDYPEEIASWYENTNTILLNKVGPDARLGHAYFFGKDGDEEAIAEALLNQLKEVAFTFNISQTILDDIGPVHGQKIITRGSGLGARPDIVEETYQG